jgi:hypothetical protein
LAQEVKNNFSALQKFNMTEPSVTTNLHQVRRDNLHLLLREFTEEQLALGATAKGIEGSFALQLEISAVTLSHIKSSRNISDKVARQVEKRTGKVAGWLDRPNEIHAPTQAESHFLELARQAWRATDAPGRRQLLKLARAGFKNAD